MHTLTLILILVLNVFWQDDPYERDREKMVLTQIEMRGVTDMATLSSMKKVQRHLFVPRHLRDNAYEDRPLPIGYGQTISQPFIVAYMTEIIRPDKNSKMLEIGTGSGYQAAVLAEIISDVYTIEIITELSNSSEKKLKELGYKNVYVKNADGYYGWKEQAPFDAIIVTAAAEFIPPPLIEQLKNGGRMIIPVGSPFQTQMLMLIEKKDGKVTTKSLMPVMFVPFKRGK
ncbi:MAG: protein-L-isoaspartate(D-aspartate) O-methyltransferase [Bacteroidota bacterium]